MLPKVLYAFIVNQGIWGIPAGAACIVYELPPGTSGAALTTYELECYDTHTGKYAGNYLLDFPPRGYDT